MPLRPHSTVLVFVLLVTTTAHAQRQAAPAAASVEAIVEALAVPAGGTACEVGAGDGALSIAIAQKLGPAGAVLANELGEGKITALQRAVAASAGARITVVAAGDTTTNFPDGRCDAVVLKDVYHHLTDPAAVNRSILRALKPGGRIVVVDFTPPGEEAPTPADRGKDGMHGVHPATVERELKDAGFETVPDPAPREQRWFMVIMARPAR
ncbi:MAG TPA: methyltransferase domain-containing protein [Vicinamibacterales bacterium]|nr:methyltransferase domain-containing protein [Vicinamibacterales bacterium]